MGMRGNEAGLRIKHRVLCGCAALMALVGSPLGAALDDDNKVTRIEEDWELRVNEPGPDKDAPQFHTVMSPTSNINSIYFQIGWNYCDNPDYRAGGLQMRAWDGDNEVGAKVARSDQLSTNAETISWTQVLKINDSALTFEIKNGNSTTWGAFGGGSETRLSGYSSLSNLNSYSPQVSTRQSWITFGANRVSQLRMKEIRYYNSDGDLIARDTTSRTIYSPSSGSGSTND